MSIKSFRSNEEWSQIVRAFVASGKSVGQFAKENGIVENTLYRNIKRHQKAAGIKRKKYAKQLKTKGIEQRFVHPSGGFITIGANLNGHIKVDKEGNIHLSNDNKEGLKTVLSALREMAA